MFNKKNQETALKTLIIKTDTLLKPLNITHFTFSFFSIPNWTEKKQLITQEKIFFSQIDSHKAPKETYGNVKKKIISQILYYKKL